MQNHEKTHTKLKNMKNSTQLGGRQRKQGVQSIKSSIKHGEQAERRRRERRGKRRGGPPGEK